MNFLEPLVWNVDIMLPELLAQYRALPRWHVPLLLLVDRRQPISVGLCEDWLHVLSSEELKRLHHLRQSADRERFVLARGLLRLLLGIWLNRPAREVLIETGPYGKPHCPGGPEFNISHSGDLILVGLHPCQHVGVDVEQIQVRIEWQSIARRFWSVDVLDTLRCLPSSEQCSTFTQYWCQYEAINKAYGWGIVSVSSSDPQWQNCAVWPIRLPRPNYRAAAALLDPITQGVARPL